MPADSDGQQAVQALFTALLEPAQGLLRPTHGVVVADADGSTCSRGPVQLFIRYVLAPLVRLVWRPRVKGAGMVPPRGPVILAANHRAAGDTAFIPLVAPRRVAFLGKAEYFTGRGLRGRLTARFLGALGSQCWFFGFALTSAANVRTLGLVEVVMAQGVAAAVFGQRTSAREIAGMALIVGGVAALLLHQVR